MTAAARRDSYAGRKALAETARGALAGIPGVVGASEAAVTGPLPAERGAAGAAAGREGRLRLALAIVAEYGVELPGIAQEVRTRAAAAVEAATGCTVAAVDVTVADLYVPGEPLVGRSLPGAFAPGARIDF